MHQFAPICTNFFTPTAKLSPRCRAVAAGRTLDSETKRKMLTLLTMLRLMLTFRLLETPMFTRVVNVVNVQRAVFQVRRGERPETARRGDGETRRSGPFGFRVLGVFRGSSPVQSRRFLLSAFCFLLSAFYFVPRLGRPWDALWDGLKRARNPMFIGLGTVGRLPEGVCMGIRLRVDGTKKLKAKEKVPKTLNLNPNLTLPLTPHLTVLSAPFAAFRALKLFETLRKTRT